MVETAVLASGGMYTRTMLRGRSAAVSRAATDRGRTEKRADETGLLVAVAVVPALDQCGRVRGEDALLAPERRRLDVGQTRDVAVPGGLLGDLDELGDWPIS